MKLILFVTDNPAHLWIDLLAHTSYLFYMNILVFFYNFTIKYFKNSKFAVLWFKASIHATFNRNFNFAC